MSIRAAEGRDAGAIKALMAALRATHLEADGRRYEPARRAWGEYARALAEGPEAAGEEATGAEPPRHGLLWLVAEDGTGAVVGYLMAEHVADDPLAWSPEHVLVHDVVLEEGSRRTGTARALIEVARRWGRERGARQVRLYTDARNEAARGAFARMGFRPTMVEMTLDE